MHRPSERGGTDWFWLRHMSRFLITGGAGFIGSNLVQRLLREGNKVRVIDNFSTGNWENMRDLYCADNALEIVIDDIRDLAAVRKAMSKIDYAVHLAALSSVARSLEDPSTYNSVNIDGTLNVLMACREERVKKLVYISSSAVYGDNPELPKVESMNTEPSSPYAVSKLTGEYYCKIFHSLYRLDTLILRPFNVFGPRQNPSSDYAAVIPRFVVALLKGRPLTIFGDGEQSRDFVYVENVVDAVVSACQSRKSGGEVINIACGHRTTVNTLVRILSEFIDNHTEPIHVAALPGDVRHSLADISKAKSLLGYEPKVHLREGLEKTIGWYLQKC